MHGGKNGMHKHHTLDDHDVALADSNPSTTHPACVHGCAAVQKQAYGLQSTIHGSKGKRCSSITTFDRLDKYENHRRNQK
jgi:hypothetical protein